MRKTLFGIVIIALIGVAVVVQVAVSQNSEEEITTASVDPGVAGGDDGVEPRSFFDYSAATNNIEPEGGPIPVTPKLLEYGEWVFRGMCIGCHGAEGDGNGAVWELADIYAPEHKLPRKPRNFTEAVFKIRSTPSGSLPTDVDLFMSISRGLVADQDMPAFKFLPERDRWAVVAYIKSFTDIWVEEAEYQEDPIEVGEPPVPDHAMVEAGKEVYAKMKCAKCHGPTGKGDGPSAPELEDDNGLPIIPRDFSDPNQFVGASDPRGIFQTFNTGLDGTPMPSFLDFLDEEQSWQLVWYVMSLRSDWDLEETRKEMGAPPVQLAMAKTDAATTTDALPTTSETPAEPDADSEAEAPGDADSDGEPTTEVEAGDSSEADVASTDQVEEKTDASSEGTEVASTAAETSEAPKPDSSVASFLDNYEEVEVTDGGTIEGKITYNGPVKRKTVLPTKDKKVCGKSRKEPLIRVGEDKGVAESVVYLKGVTSGKPWPEINLKPPQLDQKNCRFEPHVQVGRQGNLDIINSDPVLHNTHGYYGKRTAFNVALPEQGQQVSKSLKRTGTVKVDCDAHGWMLGWIQVVDNPYYFLTGEDGVYSIGDVPPGDYTLVVWQEELGETEMTVSVKTGETTTLDLELKK